MHPIKVGSLLLGSQARVSSMSPLPEEFIACFVQRCKHFEIGGDSKKKSAVY